MSTGEVFSTLLILSVIYFLGKQFLYNYAIGSSFNTFGKALLDVKVSRVAASEIFYKELANFKKNYNLLISIKMFNGINSVEDIYTLLNTVSIKHLESLDDAESQTNLSAIQQANQIEKKYLLIRAKSNKFLSNEDFDNIAKFILNKRKVELIRKNGIWVKK
jgi:hypothetical protein